MIIQYYGVEMITRDLPQVFLENISKSPLPKLQFVKNGKWDEVPIFVILPRHPRFCLDLGLRSRSSILVLGPAPRSWFSIQALDYVFDPAFDRDPQPWARSCLRSWPSSLGSIMASIVSLDPELDHAFDRGP